MSDEEADLEEQQQEIQESELKEDVDGVGARRQSVKFDLQDAEEGKPLKNKKSEYLIFILNINLNAIYLL